MRPAISWVVVDVADFVTLERAERDYNEGSLNPEVFSTYVAEAAEVGYREGYLSEDEFEFYLDQVDQVAIDFYMDKGESEYDLEIPSFPKTDSMLLPEYGGREEDMRTVADNLVSGQVEIPGDGQIVSAGTGAAAKAALVSEITGRRNNIAVYDGQQLQVFGDEIEGENAILIEEFESKMRDTKTADLVREKAETTAKLDFQDNLEDRKPALTGFESIRRILSI